MQALCLSIFLLSFVHIFSMELSRKPIYSVRSRDGKWIVCKKKLMFKSDKDFEINLSRKMYQPIVFSPTSRFLVYENKKRNLVYFDLLNDQAHVLIRKNPSLVPLLKFLTSSMIALSKIENGSHQTIIFSDLGAGWITSFNFPAGELIGFSSKRNMLLFKHENDYFFRSFDNTVVEKVPVFIERK